MNARLTNPRRTAAFAAIAAAAALAAPSAASAAVTGSVASPTAATLTGDNANDTLHGNGGLDWFWDGDNDSTDRTDQEKHNDV